MQKQNSVRIIPFATDQQGRHLTIEDIETLSGALTGKDFYLCGPAPMMDSLRKQLKAKGVPGAHIHTEEFAML
jgi:ferredoxin-NADP reductase